MFSFNLTTGFIEVESLTQRDVVSTAVGDITGLLSNPVSSVESILPLANNLCSGIESKSLMHTLMY
jgi:hypothetical protein